MAKKLENLVKKLTKEALDSLTSNHTLTAVPSSKTQMDRTITASCSCAWIGKPHRAGRDVRGEWETHLEEQAG